MLTVDEHAEKTLYLSERHSAIPGYINFDMTPYLRKPLQMFTDTSVKYIHLCSGTQVGKTVMIFSILGYIVDYLPSPTMLLYPSMDLAKGVSKERIRPLFSDSPTFSKHTTGDPNDLQLLQYTLDRCTIRYGWNSVKSVSSYACKNILADETKDLPHYISKAVEDRTKSFPAPKIIKTSSPLHPQDAIWRPMGWKRDYEAEQQAMLDLEGVSGNTLPIRRYYPAGSMAVWQWHVPCPHCGTYQLLHPDRIRWPRDCSIRDLPGTAWYQCEACGDRIHDHHKTRMERAGEWRCDNPGGNAHGFHLSSLHTLLGDINFGEIASGYLRAKISGSSEEMAAFINSYLAWPFEEEEYGESVINLTDITERADAYQKNQIPAGCRILTAGIDVHKGNIYISVWGWGDDGRGWLISWEIFECDMDNNSDAALQRLELLRSTPFDGDKRLRIIGMCVDSGYMTETVYRWAKVHNWLMPVKGKRGEVKVPEGAESYIMSSTRIEKTPKGQSVGIMLRNVNTGILKRELYDNIRSGKYEFPADVTQDVLGQINSEKLVTRRKKTTGAIERFYVKKAASDDDRKTAKNHYLDTCVYARACKEILCAGLSMDEAVAKYYKVKKKERKQAEYEDF
jgi:phage terminase large subunit GpA-like protein